VLRASTLAFFILFLFLVPISAQQQLSTTDAKSHTGEDATVCGQVASVHFAPHSRGEPTFINLEQPYPHEIFTILIWGEDRAKFGNPEAKYAGARVCVHGTITQYHGEPEIVVHQPTSMTIVTK
jgi:hypothetical protein